MSTISTTDPLDALLDSRLDSLGISAPSAPVADDLDAMLDARMDAVLPTIGVGPAPSPKPGVITPEMNTPDTYGSDLAAVRKLYDTFPERGDEFNTLSPEVLTLHARGYSKFGRVPPTAGRTGIVPAAALGMVGQTIQTGADLARFAQSGMAFGRGLGDTAKATAMGAAGMAADRLQNPLQGGVGTNQQAMMDAAGKVAFSPPSPTEQFVGEQAGNLQQRADVFRMLQTEDMKTPYTPAWFAAQIAGSVPQMAATVGTAMAGAAVGGPVGAFFGAAGPTFFTEGGQEASAIYAARKQQGATDDEALADAFMPSVATGLLNAGIEMAGPEGQAAKNLLGGQIRSKMKQIGRSVVQEGGEEMIQGTVSDLAQAGATGVAPNLDDFLEQRLQEGIVGGVMGGGFGAGAAFLPSIRDGQQQKSKRDLDLPEISFQSPTISPLPGTVGAEVPQAAPQGQQNPPQGVAQAVPAPVQGAAPQGSLPPDVAYMVPHGTVVKPQPGMMSLNLGDQGRIVFDPAKINERAVLEAMQAGRIGAGEQSKPASYTTKDLAQGTEAAREGGGISSKVRSAGLQPAFIDRETGKVYPSMYPPNYANRGDPAKPAPTHNLDGLPAEVVTKSEPGQNEWESPSVLEVKGSIEPGFIDDSGKFYTRDEAAKSAQSTREQSPPTQSPSRPDEGRTVPETPESLTAQIDRLMSGDRAAVLIPKGTPGKHPVPKGMKSITTTTGRFIYNPGKIDAAGIKKAVSEDRVGDVLGYGTPRKPADAAGVVVVRDKDGNEIQAVATNEAEAPGVIAAAERAASRPGDQVGVETAGQVIGGRGESPDQPESHRAFTLRDDAVRNELEKLGLNRKGTTPQVRDRLLLHDFAQALPGIGYELVHNRLMTEEEANGLTASAGDQVVIEVPGDPKGRVVVGRQSNAVHTAEQTLSDGQTSSSLPNAPASTVSQTERPTKQSSGETASPETSVDSRSSPDGSTESEVVRRLKNGDVDPAWASVSLPPGSGVAEANLVENIRQGQRRLQTKKDALGKTIPPDQLEAVKKSVIAGFVQLDEMRAKSVGNNPKPTEATGDKPTPVGQSGKAEGQSGSNPGTARELNGNKTGTARIINGHAVDNVGIPKRTLMIDGYPLKFESRKRAEEHLKGYKKAERELAEVIETNPGSFWIVPKSARTTATNVHEPTDTIAGRMTLDEFEAKGYTPDEVTRSDWVEMQRKMRRSLGQSEQDGTAAAPYAGFEEYHREAVKRAVDKGEEVDDRVLKDYPEFSKKKTEKNTPATPNVANRYTESSESGTAKGPDQSPKGPESGVTPGVKSESVAESLARAEKETNERKKRYRDATSKLPDGTTISAWVKTTIEGDVFWHRGVRTTTDILDEAGQKAVDLALGFTPTEIPSGGKSDIGTSADETPKWGIYQVKTSQGKRFAVRQSDKKGGFGDTLHKTEAEARQYAADEQERDARNTAFREKEASARAEKDAKDAAVKAEREDLDGFTDGMPPLQRGKVAATLDKMVSIDGKPGTIKEHVRRMVRAGDSELSTREEDVIKPKSRVQWNRMDNREQADHERRVAAAGKHTVYLVNGYDLGKIAYDYAKFLNDKQSHPAGESAARTPTKEPTNGQEEAPQAEVLNNGDTDKPAKPEGDAGVYVPVESAEQVDDGAETARFEKAKKEMIQNKGLDHKNPSGTRAILTPSSKPGVKFQQTTFTPSGKVFGDTEYKTLDDAINGFLRDNPQFLRRADLPDDYGLVGHDAPRRYIYEASMRPPGPGAVPSSGLIETLSGNEGRYGKYGQVVYSRALSEKEIEHYDLIPAGWEEAGGSKSTPDVGESTNPLTASQFRTQLEAVSKSKEEADAVYSLVEARAEAAGETVDEYVGKRLAGVVKGGKVGEGALDQESPEFRKWFGGSKVVNADGKPLVVYHGTPKAGFDTFRPRSYFGSNETAAKFARGTYADDAPGTYPAYLSLKNPLRTSDPMMRTSAGLKQAERLGHDGVIFTSKTDPEDVYYVAFEPTQIKSVNNRGTYDASDPNILHQSAYHGSPHTFDKFSTSKIGTGEGAQAYGYGLYFAGNKEVAEHYKKVLSGNSYTFRGRGYNSLNRNEKNLVEQFVGHTETGHMTPDEAVWQVRDNATKTLEIATKNLAEAKKKLGTTEDGGEGWGSIRYFTYDDEVIQKQEQTVESAREFKRAADDLTPDDIKKATGRLYHVDLKPAEDEYLLWDRPLSEQSEKVKKAIEAGRFDTSHALGHKQGEVLKKVEPTGNDIYSRIARSEPPDASTPPSDRAASQMLKELGIRGIKYQDGQSRGKPTYKLNLGKGNGYEKFNSKADADAALSRAKADGNTDATIEEIGNFNYVLFDDADVEITRMEQAKKGAIEFLKDGRAIIHAFEAADVSTMLHELGHLFRRDLTGEDAEVAAKWAGAKDGKWDRPAEEKFARGFEAYLRSGKAQNAKIKAVFQKFKEWLTAIYQTIKGSEIDVDISPEMMGVYDRLFGARTEAVQSASFRSNPTGATGKADSGAVDGPRNFADTRTDGVKPPESGGFVSVKFQRPPPFPIRKQLKDAGFRWNPDSKVWEAARTPDTEKAAADFEQGRQDYLAGRKTESKPETNGDAPKQAVDVPSPEETARKRELAGAVRLRKSAESRAEAAQAKLDQDRNTNTARRARMAEGVENDARRSLALAKLAMKVADAIEAGDAGPLSNISTIQQIEQLIDLTNSAKSKAWNDMPDTKRDAIRKERGRGQGDDSRSLPVDQWVLDRIGVAAQPWIHPSNYRDFVDQVSKLPKGKAVSEKLRRFGSYGEGSVYVTGASAELMGEWAGKLSSSASQRVGEAVREYNRYQKISGGDPKVLEAAVKKLDELREGVKAPKADPIKEMERALAGRRDIGLDFFPTPKSLAERVVEEAGITEGMKVLEPSAGNGHIADAAKAAGGDVDAVEISSTLRPILEAKGHTLAGDDFMDFNPGEVYDRVVMNPPFSNSLDTEHVRHAYDLLKPGGRLVAIMSEGPFFRSDKKATGFREWLDERGGVSEKLPDGSFNADQRGLPTTGVATRIVTIDKPSPSLTQSATASAQESGKSGEESGKTLTGDVITPALIDAARRSGEELRKEVSNVRYGDPGEIRFEFKGETYTATEPRDVLPVGDGEASKAWAVKQVLSGDAKAVAGGKSETNAETKRTQRAEDPNPPDARTPRKELLAELRTSKSFDERGDGKAIGNDIIWTPWERVKHPRLRRLVIEQRAAARTNAKIADSQPVYDRLVKIGEEAGSRWRTVFAETARSVGVSDVLPEGTRTEVAAAIARKMQDKGIGVEAMEVAPKSNGTRTEVTTESAQEAETSVANNPPKESPNVETTSEADASDGSPKGQAAGVVPEAPERTESLFISDEHGPPVESTDLDPSDKADANRIVKAYQKWYSNPSAVTLLDAASKAAVDAAYRTLSTEITVPGQGDGVRLFALPEHEEDIRAAGKKMAGIKDLGKLSIPDPSRLPPLSFPAGRPVESVPVAKKTAQRIKSIEPITAKEAGRYSLTGVLVTDGGKTLVATDGRRLSILKGEKGEFGDKDGVFEIGKDGLGKAMEGNFPPYKDVIPDYDRADLAGKSARVDATKTRRDAQKVAVMTDEENKGVVVVMNKNGTIGFAGAAEGGMAEVNVHDGYTELGHANPAFIAEAMELAERNGDQSVEFQFPKSNKPMVVKGERTTSVIMPVNLKEEFRTGDAVGAMREKADRFAKIGKARQNEDALDLLRRIDSQSGKISQQVPAALDGTESAQTLEDAATRAENGDWNASVLGSKRAYISSSEGEAVATLLRKAAKEKFETKKKPATTESKRKDATIPPGGNGLPWDNSTFADEHKWYGTRVRVAPELKGEEAWSGKVERVFNEGRLVEVRPDGVDTTFRVPSSRITLEDASGPTSAPSNPNRSRFTDRLDEKIDEIRTRRNRRQLPRGRNTGASIIGSEIRDAATIAFLQAVKAGAIAGRALTRAIDAALKSYNSKADPKKVRSVVRGLIKDAGIVAGQAPDMDRVDRAIADLRTQTRKPAQSTKQTIAQNAGPAAKGEPEFTAAETEKIKYGYAAKAAKQSFREGQQDQVRTFQNETLPKIRHKMMLDSLARQGAAFKAGEDAGAEDAKFAREQVRGIRKTLVAEIKTLPPSVRGKFLAHVRDIKTYDHLRAALDAVEREALVYESTVRARQAVSMAKEKSLLKLPEEDENGVAVRSETRKWLAAAAAQWEELKQEEARHAKGPGVIKGESKDARRRRHREFSEKSLEKMRQLAADIKANVDSATEQFHYEKRKFSAYVKGQKVQAAVTRKAMIDSAVANQKPLKESDVTDATKPFVLRRLIRYSIPIASLAKRIDMMWDGTGTWYNVLVQNFLDSNRKKIVRYRDIAEASEKVAEAAGYKSLSDAHARLSGTYGKRYMEHVTVEIGGKQRKIPKGAAMDLWAHATDLSTSELLAKGQTINFRRNKMADNQPVNIASVYHALTTQERAFVEQMKAVKDTLFAEMDATNRRLKGTSLDRQPGHWSRTRNSQMSDKIGQTDVYRNSAEFHLDNSGFLKQRTGGKVPIIIGDFLEGWHRQTNAMLQFTHLAEPVRWAEQLALHPDVKKKVVPLYGEQLIRRIERGITDASGTSPFIDLAWHQRVIRSVTARVGRALTSVNWRSWAKNLGGTFKIMAKMPMDAWRHGVQGMFKKGVLTRMMKYSPDFWHRWNSSPHSRHTGVMDSADALEGGHFVEGAKKTIGNLFHGDVMGADAALQQTLNTIKVSNAFDSVPARVAWAGWEWQVEQDHPTWSHEQKMEWVANEAWKSFAESQNTTGGLDSSAAFSESRRDPFYGALMQFTSDSTKSLAMLYDAAHQGAGEKAKTTAAIALNAAWATAVVGASGKLLWSAIAAMMGGEPDWEDAEEKAKEMAFLQASQEVANIFPILGTSLEKIRAVSQPFRRSSVMDNPAAGSTDDLLDGLAELAVAPFHEQRIKKNGLPYANSKTAFDKIWSAAYKTVRAAATVEGIPVSPIVRDIKGVVDAYSSGKK